MASSKIVSGMTGAEVMANTFRVRSYRTMRKSRAVVLRKFQKFVRGPTSGCLWFAQRTTANWGSPSANPSHPLRVITHAPEEPGPRVSPMSLSRCARNAGSLSGILQIQAGKKTQLDDLGFLG